MGETLSPGKTPERKEMAITVLTRQGKAKNVFKQLAVLARYCGARTLREIADVR
jgi:hypothetical protein